MKNKQVPHTHDSTMLSLFLYFLILKIKSPAWGNLLFNKVSPWLIPCVMMPWFRISSLTSLCRVRFWSTMLIAFNKLWFSANWWSRSDRSFASRRALDPFNTRCRLILSRIRCSTLWTCFRNSRCWVSQFWRMYSNAVMLVDPLSVFCAFTSRSSIDDFNVESDCNNCWISRSTVSESVITCWISRSFPLRDAEGTWLEYESVGESFINLFNRDASCSDHKALIGGDVSNRRQGDSCHVTFSYSDSLSLIFVSNRCSCRR